MTRFGPSAPIISCLISLVMCLRAHAATTPTFTVGYAVAGLTPNSGLVLTDGTDVVPVSTAGTFTFPTALPNGAGYNVSVVQVPGNPVQVCSVSNNQKNGVINNANVAGPTVTCAVRYGRFAYNFSGHSVSIYGLTSTGQWQHRGYLATTGEVTNLALHPTAQVLYVTTTPPVFDDFDVPELPGESHEADEPSAGTITAYAIDGASGELSPLNSAQTDSGPALLSVDPLGRFIYVANIADQVDAETGSALNTVFIFQSISIFELDSRSAQLTAAGTVSLPQQFGAVNFFPVGGNDSSLVMNSLTVDPSGRFLEVTQPSTGTITSYAIDPTSGALTSGPVNSAPGLASPVDVKFDPSGQIAFVSNGTSGVTAMLGFNSSTGVMTPLATPMSGTGFLLAIDPASRYFYTTCPTALGTASFSYDPTTGAVSQNGGCVVGPHPGSVRDLTLDPSGNFLYVRDFATDNIVTIRIDRSTGQLTQLPLPSARSRSEPFTDFDEFDQFGPSDALVVTKSSSPARVLPKSVYASMPLSNLVSSYSVNSSTGALTFVDSASANDPVFLAMFPFINFLVATSGSAATLNSFQVDPTSGGVTATSGFTSLTNTGAVVTDPSGRFAYTLSPGELVCYTGCGTTPLPAANESIISLGIEPTGEFLYATAKNEQAISIFSIDPILGGVTAVETISTTEFPDAIAFHPSGQFAYTVDATASIAQNATPTSSTIRAYSIAAGFGALTPIGTPISSGGNEPRALVVEPTGKFLYVLNVLSQNISTFSIDPTSGVLTHVALTSTGADPVSMSVDPSGLFLYVTNSSAGTISAYKLNPSTGALSAPTATAVGGQPFSVVANGALD